MTRTRELKIKTGSARKATAKNLVWSTWRYLNICDEKSVILKANCKLQEVIPDTENKGKLAYYKYSSAKMAPGITKVSRISNRTKINDLARSCHLIKMSKRKTGAKFWSTVSAGIT